MNNAGRVLAFAVFVSFAMAATAASGFPGATRMVGPHRVNPAILTPPAPPIPSGLVSTTDVQVCSQHGGFGGGLACKALLPQGSLALVWNWGGRADVIGFRVYRVDTPQRQLVGTQPHNQNDGSVFTIFIVSTVPAGGFGGKCYAVTAYWADKESSLSPEFCASSNSAEQTVVLKPVNTFSVSKTSDVQVYTTTYQTLPFMVSDSSQTVVITNGLMQNSGPTVGNLGSSALARTVLSFDSSGLAGKQIRSARLKLTVDAATSGDNRATDHYTSCVDKLGSAMDSGWQGYRDWIDATISSSSVAEQGPDVSFDVTPIVTRWARGEANYGVVLFGEADANTGHESPQDANWTGVDPGSVSSNCLTVYRPASIQLEVQYQ